MFNKNLTIDYLKFKIPINSKVPIVQWKNEENYTKVIDTNKYNYGIPCGKINNLIVIDLDLEKEKDGELITSGIEKFNEYIKQYGEFNTLTVKSRSGGFHYYFKYETENEQINKLVKQFKTTTNFHNSSIDVRTNGGYIVGPGSRIYNKSYNIINNIEPIEMPENLALWLLNGQPKKSDKPKTNKKNKINKTKKTEYNCDYIYDITIEQAKEIINKLPLEWSENRDKWLCVLTCLKNLNINGNKKLFEDFSKLSTLKKHHTKEALEMNKYQWENNHGTIDFNYLVLVVNKECKRNYTQEKHECFSGAHQKFINNKFIGCPLFYKYKQIISKPLNFKNIVEVNCEKLKYDYKHFDENEIITAQSTTGSGKTYNTAENCIEYLKNNQDKEIISIVYLQTLADQHIQSFYKDGKGIKLNDYRYCKKNELNENLVICLNSLLKLDFLTKEQMKNKIIYIDEFDSFNNYLTHNTQLDKNIKLINNLLMKLIINAHKVIISDARIDENINNFLSVVDNKKNVFVNNTFKKYKDVKAIRFHDENEFISKIKEDIKNNNYFLFGCDSCSKITNYFNEVKPKNIKNNKIDDNQDDIAITKLFEKITSDITDKSKFLLITSKTALKIKNANKEFKNKFVFFSPSIVTGLDFSIDEPQNQYLYINSLTINSQSMFQQATRTRNIKNLYFYGNQRQNDSIYENLEDVKIKNKSLVEANYKIKNVCLNVGVNYNEEIVDNSFYNQWCFNEYKNDCYNTNKIAHFENILKNQGFKLEHVGKNKQLNKSIQKAMTKFSKEEEEINYNQFIIDYINEYKMSSKTDIFDNEHSVEKYELEKNLSCLNYKNYLERLKTLPIINDELSLDKFGKIIMDEHEYKSYFNILKLFKTNDYIYAHIDDLKNTSFENKIINNIYNKIFLLRQFESLFNITPFDLNFNIDELNIDKFTEDNFKLYAFVFRSEKKIKPNNISSIRAFYTQMIKNIAGINIIKSSQSRKDCVKVRKYYLDCDIIKKYYHLSIRTYNELNYDYELLKYFNIAKPNYVEYKFGKK